MTLFLVATAFTQPVHCSQVTSRGKDRFLGACQVYRAEQLQCDVSTDLVAALKGWAPTDEPVTPAANLALFSSFSNILFIPPFKKYSWQTLRRAEQTAG